MNNDYNPYNINSHAHRQGITPEEMVRCYDEWANSYDQDLTNKYAGPKIAADYLNNYLGPGNQHLKIIDVAAGTGKVGEELVKLGYSNIDALEPSSKMLDVAKTKGVYRKMFNAYINSEPLTNIEENTYDALVIAGGMGEGHIPTEACTEIIRIVKPGGIVLIAMREEYLLAVADYKNKLEPYMKQLEKDGKWELKCRTVLPGYSFGTKNGIVFIFEIL